ncbi:endothelin-converting enzyme 1 isoform X1 [Diabrotica undecimpunctata]|uniref:endothelin-converting enzyme 1 isoform X1 n=1 Tax=Diabrotica undecimpunctata TaxID=50387 RepID=UPI003B6383CB
MDNHAYHPDENQPENRGNIQNAGNGRPFTVERNQPRSDRNDYLVEINSRAKIFKRPHFYKRLSILFLVLAIIFFILMIVFIVLYSKPKVKICTSSECIKTASSYVSSIDYSVDPCDNFYEFACGKWSEEHLNHGWWNTFSSFSTIEEKIIIETANALTEEPDNLNAPKAVKKTRDFFKSCMDVDTLDELETTTIYPILEKLNLPTIPTYLTDPNDKNFVFDWPRTETLIKNYLLMDVFMGVDVASNVFNGSENVLYVGQLSKTSPLPSPTKNKRKSMHHNIIGRKTETDEDQYKQLERNVHDNIVKYVITTIVLNVTGKPPAEDVLETASTVILDVGEFIDELQTNTTDPELSEDDIYSITVMDLDKEIIAILNKPQKSFLLPYFKYLFNGTNVTVTLNDSLYVTELDKVFLKTIMNYLADLSDIKIELYMWWMAAYAMIINTSEDISQYITKQLNSIEGDSADVVRPRSIVCSTVTQTYMGYGLSYIIGDTNFANTTKPKVERMIQGLKDSFINSVNQITWMDSKTKKVTVEKSKETISFIGYPDWLYQEGELDRYYSDVIINEDTYLENMVSVILSESTRLLKSLRKIHKREMASEPLEVNAFNYFSENSINIPMAILNFPMYHLGLEVLNYGSIGTILGHELTHAFDNTGRKYNKYGDYVHWWTNKTIETFENLTDCFIKQYDNFTIEGIEKHINGKQTLGENIADNGGLNEAIGAYKRYVAKHGEEPKLPGFENYTSFQLFFIAYANIWCQTASIEDLTTAIEYDEHCPNAIRVLGSLQNSPDFANAFHCPAGSPMNPKNKCKIW